MNAPSTKLRFAVMHESDGLPAWAKRCVERTLDCGHAELVLSICEVGGAGRPEQGKGGLLHRIYVDHWLARRSQALRPSTLEGALRAPHRLECRVLGETLALSDADVQRIDAYGLDFILRFGSCPLSGKLLDTPRFGVWSFGHEGTPAAFFWEVVSRAPATETRLERLASQNHPGASLLRGAFGTCKASWVNNVDRALMGSTDFCARACAELAQAGSNAGAQPPRPAAAAPEVHGTELELTPVARSRTASRAPSNREMVAFFAKSGAHAAQKLWELLFHVEIWNVGFTRETVAEIVHAGRVREDGVRWCKPHGPGWFIADPFAYSTAGGEQVLVEEYGPDGKGRLCRLVGYEPLGATASTPVLEPIRAAPTEASSYVELAVDFDEPYHLSYPCIFTDAGRTYCIPEAYQSRRVSLYVLEEDAWRLERALLEGEPYVDPTLFKHADLYWILCTLQDDGAWGNQKVYAYYAERLDGPFKPHPLNPVKCDIRSSRPAGSPVQIDGRLYRPSQDCSQTYGGAVVVNEITKLSPMEFEEVVVARIEPLKNGPYPDGLHTLNATANGAVIDAKRFALDPLAWRKNWGRLHEVFR